MNPDWGEKFWATGYRGSPASQPVMQAHSCTTTNSPCGAERMDQPRCRRRTVSLGRGILCDYTHAARGNHQAAAERTMRIADVVEARRQASPRPSWGAIMTKAFALGGPQSSRDASRPFSRSPGATSANSRRRSPASSSAAASATKTLSCWRAPIRRTRPWRPSTACCAPPWPSLWKTSEVSARRCASPGCRCSPAAFCGGSR